MPTRIEKVRKKLKSKKLDALLVSGKYDLAYLTGFKQLADNEREGFLLITDESAYLLTFFVNFGMYKQGGSEFETLCISFNNKLSNIINKISDKEKIKKLAFDKSSLTVQETETLRKKIWAQFIPTDSLIEDLRLVKDNQEITYIKKACQIADQAFTFILTKISQGVSEKDLALEIEFFIKKRTDNIAFSPVVAFNKNSAIPHYIPSSNVKLNNKSIILFDFGAKYGGYCSDLSRSVFFGTPDHKLIKIYQTVLDAQLLALNRIVAGLKAYEADKIAREYINSKGFIPFQHGLGHGVGLDIHENPRLKPESKTILKENMVVTVEPGIYLENFAGVRIEDLVVLKHNGIEVLTKADKAMIIL